MNKTIEQAIKARLTDYSSKAKALEFLLYLVESANKNENGIYWENNNKIIISRIFSEMESSFLGIAERYTDNNGQYILVVLLTHDLSSAQLLDVGELFYQIRYN